MTPDEVAALRDVNKVRKDLGMEPIAKLKRGVPGEAAHCPLTRSVRAGYTKAGLKHLDITANVGSIHQHDPDGRTIREWRNSDKTRYFVGDFDRGHYPELKMRRRQAG